MKSKFSDGHDGAYDTYMETTSYMQQYNVFINLFCFFSIVFGFLLDANLEFSARSDF